MAGATPMYLPPDLQAEQQRLERMRRLSQVLMMEGSKQPTQARQAGRFAVAPHPMEHAAKTAQVLLGALTESDVGLQSRNLMTQAVKHHADAARRFSESAGNAQDDVGFNTALTDYGAAIGQPQIAIQPVIQNAQRNMMARRFGLSNDPETVASGGGAAPGMSANTSQVAFGTPEYSTDLKMTPMQRGIVGALTPQRQDNGISELMAGMDQQLARLHLYTDPTGGSLVKHLSERSKPTDKMRELQSRGVQPGSPQWNAELGTNFAQSGAWQVGPNGQVQLAPGYAQGSGAIEGAQQAAKAPYNVQEFNIGGRPYRMPVSDYLAITGPRKTEQDAFNAVQTAARYGIPLSASPDASARVSDASPRVQFGGATSSESKFSEKVGAEMGDLYAGLLKSDLGAPRNIAKYERLGTLLESASTGKYQGSIVDFKAAMKSVGFDLAAFGIGDNIAPAQAARAMANHLALELRNPATGAGMPGALSDKDREFLVQSIPSLENDPNAIKLMVDYAKRLAKRDQDIAKMARAYKKRTGGFDEGFFDELSDWSSRNPLFNEQPRMPAPAVPQGFRVLGVERN